MLTQRDKKALVDYIKGKKWLYSISLIWGLSLISKLFEEMGLRCTNCTKWWSAEIFIFDELNWGTNLGDVLFTDPYYVKVTTCLCTHCGHVMHSERELSNKQME